MKAPRFVTPRTYAALLAAALTFASQPAAAAKTSAKSAARAVRWESWSDAVFARAARENKLVLLDLEAVWCHWCHVMDEKTYGDPAVARLLSDRFVAVRVDQESRPDLAHRWEEYGWPATILLDAKGKELAKRSGYIPAPAMLSMLRAFVDDPTPGPSVRPEAATHPAREAALSPALRKELEDAFVSHYDAEKGGWGTLHKFVDAGNVEWALHRAGAGDERAAEMARRTLDAGLALVDPAWGGVYQYSTGGDWNEPHFEKIMSKQAENLRCYSRAFALWHEPRHRRAAEAIRSYLKRFLTSPDGAFYTSQDADLVPGEHAAEFFAQDDAARLTRGAPRVDTHVYARENGWAIEALAVLSVATGEAGPREEAARAAEWILAHRAAPGGGFRHGEADAGARYLGDTLAMGRAFLALFEATGEPRWLEHARDAARFLAQRFGHTERGVAAGYATARGGRPQREENTALARFASALFRATGDPAHRETAERAMRWLAAPEVARRGSSGSVLLADADLRP